MSIRTTIELDHEHLENLLDDDDGIVAALIYNAAAGDSASAEKLERAYGLKVIAQTAKAG